MYVMAFSGPLGSGKTLGMSILAQYYKEVSGCTLYSNYGLRDSRNFNSFDDFGDVVEQPSSIICLDESHVDLDARSATTNVSKYMTHMFFYLRKMRATMFLTTPSFDNLDSRVRGLTDVYVQVEKDKRYFYYTMWDVQSMRFLKRMRIRQEMAFALQAYDTHAMVVPMEFPQKKEEYEEKINNLKRLNDEHYARQAAHVPMAKTAEGAAV